MTLTLLSPWSLCLTENAVVVNSHGIVCVFGISTCPSMVLTLQIFQLSHVPHVSKWGLCKATQVHSSHALLSAAAYDAGRHVADCVYVCMYVCMYVSMYVCLMSWGPTGGQQTEFCSCKFSHSEFYS